MPYLVRHHEAGRDGQVGRRGQRRDLVAEIRAALPGARIEAGPGRIVVDVERSERDPGDDVDRVAGDDDAEAVLAALHGVASYSPCRRVALDAVEAAMIALAAERAAPDASFAVRVKRGSGHASMALAAQLGAAVHGALGRRVDLRHPDVTLGVEVSGDVAYLFDRVSPGIDHRGAPPTAPAPLRFIADQMLGRLAAWLRLIGYDTLHPYDLPDSWLLRTAHAEARVILTRDRPLSQARSVRVHYVDALDVEEQLVEVAQACGLVVDETRLFTRCPRCNQPVEVVAKGDVLDRLPPAVARDHDDFRRCATCDRVYWRGDHVARVLDRLAGLPRP